MKTPEQWSDESVEFSLGFVSAHFLEPFIAAIQQDARTELEAEVARSNNACRVMGEQQAKLLRQVKDKLASARTSALKEAAPYMSHLPECVYPAANCNCGLKALYGLQEKQDSKETE